MGESVSVCLDESMASLSTELEDGNEGSYSHYYSGSIEGHKYYDTDRDGKQDEYEQGVQGWKVTLYSVSQCEEGEKLTLISCDYTDCYGAYKFCDLPPGNYRVVEEQLKGWASAECAPISHDISLECGERYGDEECENTDFFNYTQKACIDVEKLVSVDGGKTWFDADCKTGPVADPCEKILFKFVVTNTGEVELCNVNVSDNKLDLNGSDYGSGWCVGKLASGESQCLVVEDCWEYGQHTNTAKATGDAYYGVPSGYGDRDESENPVLLQSNDDNSEERPVCDYYVKTVCDEDDANYYGIKGTFDAKYWSSKIGQLAWDGKANPHKYCLPYNDLLQDTNCDGKADGLRIGDLNFDGKQNEGECTLVLSKTKALQKLACNTSGNGQIEKQLVTAWLNMLNGNSYDDGDGHLESCEPGYWIDQALKYLKVCGPKVTTKSACWTTGIDTDKSGSYEDMCDIKSGYEILKVLTQYNKDGTIPSDYCKDHSLPEKDCDCNDYGTMAQVLLANAAA